MVVPAGGEAPELAHAEQALVVALRTLGLSDDGKPRSSRTPSIQARFTPVVGPGGAGLMLSGRF